MSKKNYEVCPICGSKAMKYPALSRYDNKTEVCPECGLMESLNGNIIITCLRLKLNFTLYAGIMAQGGPKNTLYKAISQASKQLMKSYKPTKPK
jgi:RNA polymerase subunit RPABC4/transcription elongation factor Spt4